MSNQYPPSVPDGKDDLARLWRRFAETSVGEYSPIYHASILAATDNREVIDVVRRAPEDRHLPNNLQAAVHYLVLEGIDHPVAELYNGVEHPDPGAIFCDAVLSNADRIVELMTARPVQTNEVARIGVIAPVLTLIGKRHGTPLALIDAGTSAGLNLFVDDWTIDYRTEDPAQPDVTIAPPTSSTSGLHLQADSFGLPPVSSPARINWRYGFDRNPIDVRNPEQALWLRSLLWPGHTERQERLDAAIAHAQAHPQQLHRHQAIEGLSAALAAAPDDLLPVVLTSWVVYYFDEELRKEFDAAIAGSDRPVIWVSMEARGVVDVGPTAPTPDRGRNHSVIGMVTSDGGRVHREFAGWTGSHGGWIDLALDE